MEYNGARVSVCFTGLFHTCATAIPERCLFVLIVALSIQVHVSTPIAVTLKLPFNNCYD